MPITAVQFGLVLANIGSFPIYFEFGRMEANFSGKMVSQSVRTKGAIMPNRPSTIRSTRVPFNPPIQVAHGAVEEGHLVFEVLYGRSERRLKYRIAHRVRVTAKGAMASGPLDVAWAYDEDEKVIKPTD